MTVKDLKIEYMSGDMALIMGRCREMESKNCVTVTPFKTEISIQVIGNYCKRLQKGTDKGHILDGKK